ncbi:hypothetical protein ZIOFF_026107 [Zingiber officinale]|uniref:Uncharacterized protein n=1 Tax=Zingiber officinale TaxID=94328 RepID=A0A8J5GVZ3_ZINOF|nr:hypothetical protein ZIOFF_026107 [Zingiber officinale]
MRVPPWREQVTVRALVVSLGLSVMLSVIVMKLDLTTGVIPSLNVASSLLGFFFIKVWTKALEHAGVLRVPFTRQENTVIQTCVVSAYGIAFSGGFGNYLLGMSSKIAGQATEANDSQNIKDPKLGWMIAFMFVVSFVGLFSLVPLRKIMIIDYKLIYPSGTATAYLINGFHTPQGENLAKKQVKTLGKLFLFSFLWGLFQWFYKSGDGCGFEAFPTFGLKAYENKFNFDFSASYVGVGMICPHIVNASLLIGAILSWGIMWPLINNQKGNWFSADLSSDSLHGLEGYRVNPCCYYSVSIILGDGLYNFFKVMTKTVPAFVSDSQKLRLSTLPVLHEVHMAKQPIVSYDDDRRTEVFLKDQIPKWVAIGGYGMASLVSIITLPRIFPPLKWHFILAAYAVAPVLAFCNAYGCGLTDWSLPTFYGKFAIFIFGAWAGANHGGVLAGLASCGVMLSIVSTASDLMQDFKTGHLNTFFSETYAFDDIRVPGRQYPAPSAILHRNIAILGVHAFAIDMFIGTVILFVWQKMDRAKTAAFGPAVASGLMCGELVMEYGVYLKQCLHCSTSSHQYA